MGTVSATVSTERATGRGKGYGFVRFSDLGQMLLAVERMNGVECVRYAYENCSYTWKLKLSLLLNTLESLLFL
ncbi:BnaC06g43450D [Brassica napus]|uniref:RRM domain-containing protein n=4 Tax=Brassica TaxID=3705 RepID=A0A0D3CXP8_BRAOL|nr:hypothetical protein Bca52824_083363 [Brassica carinata]CAF2061989.1 unnamed protein product [Brassica napus]CDY51504.1 BnaC06g43450D [Brassica napus]VDD63356.1 unnamed protein product [Brassica oleracea]